MIKQRSKLMMKKKTQKKWKNSCKSIFCKIHRIVPSTVWQQQQQLTDIEMRHSTHLVGWIVCIEMKGKKNNLTDDICEIKHMEISIIRLRWQMMKVLLHLNFDFIFFLFLLPLLPGNHWAEHLFKWSFFWRGRWQTNISFFWYLLHRFDFIYILVFRSFFFSSACCSRKRKLPSQMYNLIDTFDN